jgi:hypothetical protein
MANENIKNFMLRIPNELHEQLKTYRVELATKTKDIESLHSLIFAAIKEKIARGA